MDETNNIRQAVWTSVNYPRRLDMPRTAPQHAVRGICSVVRLLQIFQNIIWLVAFFVYLLETLWQLDRPKNAIVFCETRF